MVKLDIFGSVLFILIGILVITAVATTVHIQSDTTLNRLVQNAGDVVVNQSGVLNTTDPLTLTNGVCVENSVVVTNATNVVFASGNYSATCTNASSIITWLNASLADDDELKNVSYSYLFDTYNESALYNVSGSAKSIYNLYDLYWAAFGLIFIAGGMYGIWSNLKNSKK